jgi:hypothetical protein
MRLPLNRKSRAEQVAEMVTGSLEMPGRPAKLGLVAAGSLAALTAASARISSLRRRGQS